MCSPHFHIPCDRLFLASLGPDESDEPTPTAVGPRLALCFLLYVCALAAKTPAALTPVAGF
jgi:hypothetical protein